MDIKITTTKNHNKDNKMPKCTCQYPSSVALAGSLSALTLAMVFSGCVPVTPSLPTSSLYFVPAEGSGADRAIQKWNPKTGLLTTAINNAQKSLLLNAQPHGSTLLYYSGVLFGSGVVGSYVISNPDSSTQPRQNILSMSGEFSVSGQAPVWAPDGKNLSVIDNGAIYITSLTGQRTLIGPGSEAFWSPDARKLAYFPTNSHGAGNVYELITGNIIHAFDPSYGLSGFGTDVISWSADSQHLLLKHVSYPQKELIKLVVDADAELPAPYWEYSRLPASATGTEACDNISPTADRAVSCTKSEGTTSYSLRFADGRNDVPLPAYANWSTAGDFLYYIIDIDNDSRLDVVVANADGLVINSQALPLDHAVESFFSPLSKQNQIALSTRDADNQIHSTLINLPSGQMREIFSGTDSRLPTINSSPNGKYLLLDTADTTYFYDSRFNGSVAQSLAMKLPVNQHTTWAPNSENVSFCPDLAPTCSPKVLTITATGHTVTQVPAVAWLPLVWTDPG